MAGKTVTRHIPPQMCLVTKMFLAFLTRQNDVLAPCERGIDVKGRSVMTYLQLATLRQTFHAANNVDLILMFHEAALHDPLTLEERSNLHDLATMIENQEMGAIQ
jgi:hypothetical protein